MPTTMTTANRRKSLVSRSTWIGTLLLLVHQSAAFSIQTLHNKGSTKHFPSSTFQSPKTSPFGLAEDKIRYGSRLRDSKPEEYGSALKSSGNSLELSKISSVTVSTLSGDDVSVGSLLSGGEESKKTTILACLSHFGDFNAWEVAQQYIAAYSSGDLDSDCNVVLVGIGSVASAKKFSDDLGLDKEDRIQLFADETGAVTEACGCYKGWLAIDKEHAKKWPATDVNPYIKLFGMIFGIGSPGTIGRVLYGYLGDKEGDFRSRKWVVDALLIGTEKGRFPQITSEAFEGVPENSGLRPFELATLRAQTGIHIVLNWGKLGPSDGDLFTRMGGTFVFKDNVCVYEYYDKGILTYAPLDEVCKVVKNG